MKNVHRRHQIALRRRPKNAAPRHRINPRPQSEHPAFILAAKIEAAIGPNPRYMNAYRKVWAWMSIAQWDYAEEEIKRSHAG